MEKVSWSRRDASLHSLLPWNWEYRLVPDSIGFVPALEGLRGVALLFVLYHHTFGFNYFGKTMGACGVSIFFTLSGFLITGILKQLYARPQLSFPRALLQFYTDRFVRLTPAMALVVPAGMYMAIYVMGNSYEEVRTWGIRAFFYLENQETFYPMKFPWTTMPCFDHFWSLACEEQFYIIWSLTLALLLKIKRVRVRTAILYAGLAFSVFVQYRIIYWRSDLFSAKPYMTLPASFYKMLMGAMLRLVPVPAIFFHPRMGFLLAVGIFASTGVYAYHDCFYGTNSITEYTIPGYYSLATYILLPSLLERKNALLELPILRFIGRISYALYLWHFVVMTVDNSRFSGWPGVRSDAVATLIAMASTFYVEEPFRAWFRNRYRRRPSAELSMAESDNPVKHGYIGIPMHH